MRHDAVSEARNPRRKSTQSISANVHTAGTSALSRWADDWTHVTPGTQDARVETARSPVGAVCDRPITSRCPNSLLKTLRIGIENQLRRLAFGVMGGHRPPLQLKTAHSHVFLDSRCHVWVIVGPMGEGGTRTPNVASLFQLRPPFPLDFAYTSETFRACKES